MHLAGENLPLHLKTLPLQPEVFLHPPPVDCLPEYPHFHRPLGTGAEVLQFGSGVPFGGGIHSEVLRIHLYQLPAIRRQEPQGGELGVHQSLYPRDWETDH